MRAAWDDSIGLQGGPNVDIIELVARSEWPIVVGAALLIFRRPIQSLIARVNLTKIDAWGFKAEFEKGLDKIEALTFIEPAKTRAKIATDELRRLDNSGASATGATPEGLVLDSWRQLEGTMRRLVDELHPNVSRTIHPPPLRFEAAAEELGLSADDMASLLLMRKLRNDLAHSPDARITWDDALRFQVATRRLMNKLRKPSEGEETK